MKEEYARIAKTIVKNNERKLFQYTLLYKKPPQIQVVWNNNSFCSQIYNLARSWLKTLLSAPRGISGGGDGSTAQSRSHLKAQSLTCVVDDDWCLGPSLGCWPQYLYLLSPSAWLLSFLTAWWLGSTSKCPKRAG